MKQARGTVPWEEGIDLRHAARLVRQARSFRSSVLLKLNERITDARSIFGVLLLCATLGSVIDLEVSGEDEDLAMASLTSLFEPGDQTGGHNAPGGGAAR